MEPRVRVRAPIDVQTRLRFCGTHENGWQKGGKTKTFASGLTYDHAVAVENSDEEDNDRNNREDEDDYVTEQFNRNVRIGNGDVSDGED